MNQIKLSTFNGSWRNKGIPEKKFFSASLSIVKPLTVWITTKCGKFLRIWKYWIAFPISRETCMWISQQQRELDWNIRLVQKWEKSGRFVPLHFKNNLIISWSIQGEMDELELKEIIMSSTIKAASIQRNGAAG